jgi:hypothetical protein
MKSIRFSTGCCLSAIRASLLHYGQAIGPRALRELVLTVADQHCEATVTQIESLRAALVAISDNSNASCSKDVVIRVLIMVYAHDASFPEKYFFYVSRADCARVRA